MSPATHLRLPGAPLCVSEHPSQPLVAVGLSAGGVSLTNLTDLHTSHPTLPDACVTHALPSGCQTTGLFPSNGITDGLLLAAAESTIHIFSTSRSAAVRAYALPPMDDVPRAVSAFLGVHHQVGLVGDDAGGLHVVDSRQSRLAASVLQQGDFISSLVEVQRFGTHAIMASSGDGSLCFYDLRGLHASKQDALSLSLQYATDSFQDDLLSLAVLPDLPMAVAGCMSGALNLYNLRILDTSVEDDTAEHVDRFHGHPDCVNAVLATGQSGVVTTASSDGIVRVVDIMQRSLVGVLEYMSTTTGEEEEEEEEEEGTSLKVRKRKRKMKEWPIESMVEIHGDMKRTYALLSHDNCMRFCDASILDDDDNEDDEAKEDEREKKENNQDEQCDREDVQRDGAKVAEEGVESVMKEGGGSSEKRGLVQRADAALSQTRGKNAKKKKKKGGNDGDNVNNRQSSDFFADL